MRGNSEYMFGVENGRLSSKEVARRERIAKKHGADFVYANIPGDGLVSWFTCDNFGSPHNENTMRRVMVEVDSD